MSCRFCLPTITEAFPGYTFPIDIQRGCNLWTAHMPPFVLLLCQWAVTPSANQHFWYELKICYVISKLSSGYGLNVFCTAVGPLSFFCHFIAFFLAILHGLVGVGCQSYWCIDWCLVMSFTPRAKNLISFTRLKIGCENKHLCLCVLTVGLLFNC